ncbi:hypothetical protein GH714_010171 [Hevea brasiliensis]|uniref:Reverse transcriptase Ty1/copia-type domain-containing protein n=1 Tax=Hevea brasiliensis TaxID=3981 RepID=A0A6A6M496_HEVBR|nr:hypothetical protein GH714_010171 [Hevea brasiliensis]
MSPVSSPFDPAVKLRKNTRESVSQYKYSQIIGALLHLANHTRPDIAYAVGRLVMEGYSDANWIFYSEETKSTSGYVFTISGGVVSWKSAKQIIISRSAMEVELMALDATNTEAEWLQNFMNDLPFIVKPLPPFQYIVTVKLL